VYAKVIKDVCEASRVDFEEGGVDLNALEMLRQVRDFLLHFPAIVSRTTINNTYLFLASASRSCFATQNIGIGDQNSLHRRR